MPEEYRQHVSQHNCNFHLLSTQVFYSSFSISMLFKTFLKHQGYLYSLFLEHLLLPRSQVQLQQVKSHLLDPASSPSISPPAFPSLYSKYTDAFRIPSSQFTITPLQLTFCSLASSRTEISLLIRYLRPEASFHSPSEMSDHLCASPFMCLINCYPSARSPSASPRPGLHLTCTSPAPACTLCGCARHRPYG